MVFYSECVFHGGSQVLGLDWYEKQGLRSRIQSFIGLRVFVHSPTPLSSLYFYIALVFTSNWENQFYDHKKVSLGPIS